MKGHHTASLDESEMDHCFPPRNVMAAIQIPKIIAVKQCDDTDLMVNICSDKS